MATKTFFAGVAIAAALSGCDDLGGVHQDFLCPDRDAFMAYVSPVIERRCGMLDCHGQTTRPLRIYGELGLRSPFENNRSGGIATTGLERRSNYEALCSIEPEKMSQVTLDFGQSAQQLLLVRKARGLEGHKGGKVLNSNDDFDVCIVGWLQGRDTELEVKPACEKALERLP